MDKINGIEPENNDWSCAIICGIYGGCTTVCGYLCIPPYAYVSALTIGLAAKISGNYYSGKAQME